MAAPPDSTSPYRLIVEGKDDKWAVINLLKRNGYDWDDISTTRPFIAEVGGVEAALAALAPALKTYERLGLIVDADLDVGTRWGLVRSRLEQLGVRLQSDLETSGLVLNHRGSTGRSVRFGAWLMPDNQSSGALEDFIATLVPREDTVWGHADSATTVARNLGAPVRSTDQAKGSIHAWLAWQDKPGQPFGTALSARVLAHDSAQALQFVNWFRRLFIDP